MKHLTKPLILLGTVLGAVGLAAVGWAYWTSSGTGAASATVATLNPPTGVAVTQPTPGNIHVTWNASAASSPAVAPSGYYVQRLDGTLTPTDACGSSLNPPLPTLPTSCDDSSVPAGTYTYTVTAVLGSGSWTAVSDASASVKVKNSQTITFTSTAPTATVGGPTYIVTATGGASGNLVTFTLDGTSAGCSLAGSTISFTAVGTCVISANQDGNDDYNAAAQAQQSFAVGKGAQTVTFTSTAPTATVGGPTYIVTATGGASGNLVTFTLDGTSAGCSLAGSTISFTAVGTCVISANQDGNTNYNPAPQVQQFIAVNAAPSVTTTSLATATQGQVGYSQTLASSGGTGAITWSLSSGSLPSGLSLASSTGVISGDVGAGATTETFTVAATDTNGVAGTRSLTLTVNAAPTVTGQNTTAGGTLTIKGSGFAPNSTLTVSIKDAGGVVWSVTPTPTTSDGSGSLNGTTGIQVTVPSGVAHGPGNSKPGTVTVTDAVGNTGTSLSFRIG